MRIRLTLFFILFLTSAAVDAVAMPTALVNARWFDGDRFIKRTMYIVDGKFSRRKPKTATKYVDLNGQFVIPPLGDAHTHNLSSEREYGSLARKYLDEGTFYVQVLGNPTAGVGDVRTLLDRASGLEVLFANAPWTATLGHPFMVYEPLALGIYDPSENKQRLPEILRSRLGENDSYIFADSLAELDAKWPRFLAGKPNLVKIILIDAAEELSPRRTKQAGELGLTKEVAAEVVKLAKKSGLRVYAHIETASDFRIGLDIGVDGFAHAPDYGWDGAGKPPEDLTPTDLRRAARAGVVLVPTAARAVLSAVTGYENGAAVYDEVRLKRIKDRQRRILQSYQKAGLRFAFGTDLYGQTIFPELFYLAENDIFDNRTIIRIATMETPAAIFPNRRIGCLSEGCEASFLTLAADPTRDLGALRRIVRRFKSGNEILF